MTASRPSASSTWVSRLLKCEFMNGSSREVRDNLAAKELYRLLHLWDRTGDEEHARQGRDAGLDVDADPLADLLGAANQVALLEAAGLLAERGVLERLEMLIELRGVEALARRLVGAADGDRELGCDVDLRAVAPGLRRVPVDVLDPALDLLRREDGGHPAFGVFARAPPHLGVVATGVQRQRVLRGLREALDLLEVHVRAAEGRPALGEEKAQRAHPLVDDRATVHVLRIGEERLVLLAVGARADAEDHTPARELVERGHLLGEHRYAAHRKHDDAGRDPELRRPRGDVAESDERLVEVRRLGELALDVALGRHVVVAPDRVVAEPLTEHCRGKDVRRPREGDRVHHPFDTRRDVNAELQRHRMSAQKGTSVSPIRASCPTRSAARGTTAISASSPASAKRRSAARQSSGVPATASVSTIASVTRSTAGAPRRSASANGVVCSGPSPAS